MFVIPTLMPLALFGTWLLMNLPTFTLMKFASIIVKWEDPDHQKEEDESQEERRFLAVDDQWTKVNTTGKGSHKHDKYSTELRLQHYKNMETRIAWEITHIKHNLQGRLTKMRPRICTTLNSMGFISSPDGRYNTWMPNYSSPVNPCKLVTKVFESTRKSMWRSLHPLEQIKW